MEDLSPEEHLVHLHTLRQLCQGSLTGDPSKLGRLEVFQAGYTSAPSPLRPVYGVMGLTHEPPYAPNGVRFDATMKLSGRAEANDEASLVRVGFIVAD